jgi:hypothetical protein
VNKYPHHQSLYRNSGTIPIPKWHSTRREDMGGKSSNQRWHGWWMDSRLATKLCRRTWTSKGVTSTSGLPHETIQ